MSYEGYVKRLCQNGHLYTSDCYDEQPPQCPTCQAEFVWWANVDQTNCDLDPKTGLEWGDVALEVDTPAVTETCAYCGHVREVAEVRYKIPTHAGHILIKDHPVDQASREPDIARKLVELGYSDEEVRIFDAGTRMFTNGVLTKTWGPRLRIAKFPFKVRPDPPPPLPDEEEHPPELVLDEAVTVEIPLEQILAVQTRDEWVALLQSLTEDKLSISWRYK